MAWIRLVQGLAIASPVVWPAIRMHILWANAFEHVLIQAGLLASHAAKGGVDRPIAESEHEVTLMMCCHLHLKLHALS